MSHIVQLPTCFQGIKRQIALEIPALRSRYPGQLNVVSGKNNSMTFFTKMKVLLLSLIVSLKTKKVFCDCGGEVKPKQRDGEPAYTSMMVYTRHGSEEGRHYESR